jgi:hypothetical protein
MNEIKKSKEIGYTVDEAGIVYKPNGIVQKLRLNDNGYLVFSLRVGNIVKPVKVHRLQAFILYGESLFEKDIVVRHLDSNKKNNKSSNISIGTKVDNHYDMPKSQRDEIIQKMTKAAVLKNTKYDHNAIKNDKINGMSNKDIIKKHKISSKSSLSYILNVKLKLNI